MAISFVDLRNPSMLGVQGTLASLEANLTKTAAKDAEIHDPSQTAKSLTDWVVARADPNPLVGYDRDIALDLARDKAAALSPKESAEICTKLIDAMGRGRVLPRDAQLYFKIIGDIVESRGSEVMGGRGATAAMTLAEVVGNKLSSTTGVVASMFQVNPHVTSSAMPADLDCFGLGVRLLSNLANHGQTASVQSVIRPHVPAMSQFAVAHASLDPDGRFRVPAANFLEAAGETGALDNARVTDLEREIASTNARPDLAKIADFIDKSGSVIDLADPVRSGSGMETYGQLLARALHIEMTATRSANVSPNAQKLADYLGEPTNFASLDAAARDSLLRAHMNIAGHGGSTDFLIDHISQLKDIVDVSTLAPRDQLRELENISGVIELKLAQAPGIKGRNIHQLDDVRSEVAVTLLTLCADPSVASIAAQQLCALAHKGDNPIARSAFYNQLKNASPAMAVVLGDALDDAVKGGVVQRSDLDIKALKQAQMAFGKLKRFGDYRWFNKSADPDTKEANRLIRGLLNEEPVTGNTPSVPAPNTGRSSVGAWFMGHMGGLVDLGKRALVFSLKVAAVGAVGLLAAGAGSAIVPLLASAGVVTFGSAAAMASVTTIASAATGILVGGFTALKLRKL